MNAESSSKISTAAKRFCDNSLRLCEFLILAFDQQVLLGRMTSAFVEVLDKLHEQARHELELEKVYHSVKPLAELGAEMTVILKPYTSIILDVVFCRTVDNYLAYLSELLALIFEAQPNTLRSNEQVTVDFILEHSDFEDLLNGLIEKKVMELSFKGMRDLAKYLDSRLKFALFKNDDDLLTAVKIIEDRNILIHNRGIINRRYLKHCPQTSLNLGETIRLEPGAVLKDLLFLQNNALWIDGQAGEKFQIPRLEEQPLSYIDLNFPFCFGVDISRRTGSEEAER
jgi:hypothetical protein